MPTRSGRFGLPLVLSLMFALLAAACVSGETSEVGSQDEPAETTAPDPGDPEVSPVDPLVAAVAELGGQLAITNDTELWVTQSDGSEPQLVEGGEQVSASQPVWSADGSLAWVALDAVGHHIRVGPGTAGDVNDTIELGGFPAFYLSFNPVTDEVGFLRTVDEVATEDLEFGVVAYNPINETIAGFSPVAQGAPLFVSWNSTEDLAAVVRDEATLELYRQGEPAGLAALEETLVNSGPPAWLDEDTLLVAGESSILSIEIVDGQAPVVTPVLNGTGLAQFTLSAQSQTLAFVMPMEGDGDGSPPLRTLDLETNEIVTVTPDPVLAWEWDHEGDRLAYLAQADAGSIDSIAYPPTPVQDEALRWFFWDDGILLNSTPPFVPTRLVAGAYLPFFAQFTQSHHRWSPEGAGFAYAGVIEGESGVWVQLVGAPVESLLVHPGGESVTWSITDGSGGGPSIL